MNMAAPIIVTTDIVSVLQTALAPAFLLVGLSGMLNIFTGRLARIIDRTRIEQDRFEKARGKERQNCNNHLYDLQRRMKFVNNAIYLSVVSAIVVCCLIGLLFLMKLLGLPHIIYIVAGAFILAVALLALALMQFAREVHIGIRDFMTNDRYVDPDNPDS